MATPTIILLSDSEDELEYDLSPSETHTILNTNAYVAASEEEEEDPSENEVMETEPEEEEEDSSENDTMEYEPEEEEEEIPPTPIAPIASPQPQRTPSFRPYRTHPGGPLRMFTPRKKVIPPQRVSLSVPESTPAPRRRTDARRWGWMPNTLQTWREAEGIPSTHEVGEPSTTSHIPTLTQEPVHHTVPLLVARMANHEHQLRRIHHEMEEIPFGIRGTLQELTTRIEAEAIQNSQLFWSTQILQSTTQTEISQLRHRLEECEERNAELSQRVTAMERRESPAPSHT